MMQLTVAVLLLGTGLTGDELSLGSGHTIMTQEASPSPAITRNPSHKRSGGRTALGRLGPDDLPHYAASQNDRTTFIHF